MYVLWIYLIGSFLLTTRSLRSSIGALCRLICCIGGCFSILPSFFSPIFQAVLGCFVGAHV